MQVILNGSQQELADGTGLVELIDSADARWRPDAILFETNAAFLGIKDLLVRHARFGPRVHGVAEAVFISSAASTVVRGALGRSRPALHQGTTRITLRTDRAHFVQADHTAARRRRGVEGFDLPLFSAKAGSTRSPNQVSCFRQRKPSWSRISSIRLRCIAMPFASCR